MTLFSSLIFSQASAQGGLDVQTVFSLFYSLYCAFLSADLCTDDASEEIDIECYFHIVYLIVRYFHEIFSYLIGTLLPCE